MPDNKGTKKQAEVYFRIKGQPAELFEKCRAEAMKRPEFWQFSQLSRADFGRHLLMKALVGLGKELGLIDEPTSERPDE